MRAPKAALLIYIVFGVVGCTPLEKTAYRTIVGAKAFLDTVKSKHPECQNSNVGVCEYLAKATAGKDLLIDAVEIYCASPQFTTGGPCTPPTDHAVKSQAEAKLKAAIAGYEQTESDLRAVLK